MPRFLGRFLQNHRATLTALALGIAHAFTFAPWGSDWLELLVLTGFAGLLLSAIGQHAQRHGHAHRRPSPGPFRLGLLFGIGWFSAGIGWVYVSMHHYGGGLRLLRLHNGRGLLLLRHARYQHPAENDDV